MYLCFLCFFCFFKQKTAYEMRISDWSSDVCSSDLYRGKACSFSSTLDVRTAKGCAMTTAIGISGSYGGLNLGDEAILASAIAQFRAEIPGVEIGRASCRERVCQYV